MNDVLASALTVPGVTAAALLSGDGELLATATAEAPGFEDAGPQLAAALAAARVLSEPLGGGLSQAVLEYRTGPVVLAFAPDAVGADGADADTVSAAEAASESPSHVLVLRLRTLADLGRARFELPRLLVAAAPVAAVAGREADAGEADAGEADAGEADAGDEPPPGTP